MTPSVLNFCYMNYFLSFGKFVLLQNFSFLTVSWNFTVKTLLLGTKLCPGCLWEKVFSVAYITKRNPFFYPWVLVCFWNAICVYVAKLEQQEPLGHTLINHPAHFGRNRSAELQLCQMGLRWLILLQNLIIFASCVKEFTTRKYFKFHDIWKKLHNQQNSWKNKLLAKGSPLLLLSLKISAIVKEQVVGWGTWKALEMWFSSLNRAGQWAN